MRTMFFFNGIEHTIGLDDANCQIEQPVTRVNFSAQNDVRVGLQWEDFFRKMQLKNLSHHFSPSILHFFSPHTRRLPVLNPQPLYPQLRRLILQTINKLPTHSYIALPPQNKLPPLTPFYPPWQPNSYIIYPLWTNYPVTPLGSPTL